MNDRRVTQAVFRLLPAMAIVLMLAGCAQSAHQTGQDLLDTIIPAEVMAQVDQSVSFADLRASPNDYIGRTVMFGGVALKSQRVKDRTEIEILQLPTGPNRTPSDQRTQSEGRFIAVRSGAFLDPAVIERGSPLTVIGEVKGAVTKPLDEGEYQYPVLEIMQLVDWNDLRSRDRGRGYGGGSGYAGSGYGYQGYGPYGYGPWGYGGYGSPFWRPYGYGGGFYPYSNYGGGGGLSPGPSPSPPRPSSIPPQFRKSR